MKRKFLFAAITTFAISGAMSCWSVAQNPNPPGASLLLPLSSNVRLFSPQSSGGPAADAPQIAAVQDNGNKAIRTVVQRYSAAEDASSKEQITVELKQLVDTQFDGLQDAKSLELKKLEEQLAKLKELHSKRAKQKEQIVADRVQQIVREADGLGWGTSENLGSWRGLTTGYATFAPNVSYSSYPAAASTPSVSTSNVAPARVVEPTTSPLPPAR